jgi:hypothetical protein
VPENEAETHFTQTMFIAVHGYKDTQETQLFLLTTFLCAGKEL